MTDEVPSEMVHSVENLKLETEKVLSGSDTLGYKLIYTKIE